MLSLGRSNIKCALLKGKQQYNSIKICSNNFSTENRTHKERRRVEFSTEELFDVVSK